jgi:hypothetical protein
MASSVEVTAAAKIEQVRRKWDHLGMSEPATRQLEVVHEGSSFRLMDYAALWGDPSVWHNSYLGSRCSARQARRTTRKL